jgi:hypothetical protein
MLFFDPVEDFSLKKLFDFLRPCTPVAKSWLVNLSVASFAIGLFEFKIPGIAVGTVLLVCAFVLSYVKEK